MIKTNESGEFVIEIKMHGGGEHLVRVQKALLLGIEVIGSHREHSGYEDHQDAVWVLSSLLKEVLPDMSMMNLAMGGKPYRATSKE